MSGNGLQLCDLEAFELLLNGLGVFFANKNLSINSSHLRGKTRASWLRRGSKLEAFLP